MPAARHLSRRAPPRFLSRRVRTRAAWASRRSRKGDRGGWQHLARS